MPEVHRTRQVAVEASWQVLDQQMIWLTCSVRDTGIGIDSDRLEMMFVAFQQADSSISRRYGGTGLGLSIARTLAERMGGQLRGESREGLGSTFTLEMPLALANAPRPRLRHGGAGALGGNGERCCWWRTTRSTRASSKPCCAAWASRSAWRPMAPRRSTWCSSNASPPC
jgi:hypothetical protein